VKEFSKWLIEGGQTKESKRTKKTRREKIYWILGNQFGLKKKSTGRNYLRARTEELCRFKGNQGNSPKPMGKFAKHAKSLGGVRMVFVATGREAKGFRKAWNKLRAGKVLTDPSPEEKQKIWKVWDGTWGRRRMGVPSCDPE